MFWNSSLKPAASGRRCDQVAGERKGMAENRLIKERVRKSYSKGCTTSRDCDLLHHQQVVKVAEREEWILR